MQYQTNTPLYIKQARKTSWTKKLLFLLGPILLTAALILLISFLGGAQIAHNLILSALASFFALGKFIIFTGLLKSKSVIHFWHYDFQLLLAPYQLGLMVIYMDMCVAFIIAYNIDLLYRIKWFGQKINRMHDNCEQILAANSWMRRITILGLICFVAFPLTGTGAIGGTIFGHLVGLKRRTIILGIGFGSVLGCALITIGAYTLGKQFGRLVHHPLIITALVLLLLLFLWWFNRIMRHAPQQAESLEK